MKKNNEQEMYELSPLGQQYRAELLSILVRSESDLEGALAAMDYYLAQNPPPAFQNALLAWKGLFYIEHGRYDDAVQVLRAADALRVPDDQHNFITKYNLAKALDLGGHPEEAYSVIVQALNEIDTPSLLFDLLPALASFCSTLDHALPERAELALRRGKAFYGIDDQDAMPDLMSEIWRATDLKSEAAAGYGELERGVRETESLDEKLGLIDIYLRDVKVPFYKGLAENLLRRVRQEAEAKS